MRSARAEDFRRRIVEKAQSWPARISRVGFQGMQSLGDGEIPLISPVSVICGPNGVGKSTLLRTVWALLDPAGTKTAAFGQPKAGRAVVELQLRNTRREFETAFPAPELAQADHNVEIAYIDTSTTITKLQEELIRFEDVEIIINGVGARTLNDTELGEINFLTTRNYREIKLYEIEIGDRIAPFFEVTYAANRYDSRTMGLGEYAAFFLWWRLTTAQPQSIALIEEPECFLSPASQRAFVDFLCGIAWEKKINCIITSHSPEIIVPFHQESIRFLRRDPTGIKIAADKPSPPLLETIGIRSHQDVIAFVEDVAAMRFCKFILERYDPTLARRITTHSRDGIGEIARILQQVEPRYGTMSIVGIFDGDSYDEVKANHNSVLAKSAFLPGSVAIERAFKDLAESDPQRLARAIGKDNVDDLLSPLGGRDHHDWFLDAARNLGLEPGQFFMVMFGIWVAEPENERTSRTFVESLGKLLGSGDPPPSVAKADIPVNPEAVPADTPAEPPTS